VDLVWIYADQAQKYSEACAADQTQEWDCSLWSRFGKPNGFAYIQTGMYDYSQNGTTLAVAKRGSGVADLINPAMQKFMRSREYYDICKKHGLER